jgi:hypothetical protein
MFSVKEFVFLVEFEAEGGEHLGVSFEVAVHNGLAEFADGVHDELGEGSSEGFALFGLSVSFPFHVGGIIEVVSPEFGHHLVLGNSELLGVESGEFGEGEGPLIFS